MASVWYVWAVTAEGFSAAGDMRYRSDLEHQGLYWWMAYELLSFASADPQVIVLPSAPKASEEDKAGLREWVLAEAEKCSDRLIVLEAQVSGAGSLTVTRSTWTRRMRCLNIRLKESRTRELTRAVVVARKRMRSRKISKHGGGDLQLLASKEGGSGVWKGG